MTNTAYDVVSAGENWCQKRWVYCAIVVVASVYKGTKKVDCPTQLEGISNVVLYYNRRPMLGPGLALDSLARVLS